MTPLGLGLIVVALLSAGGFVAATVRADARVHAIDPASTSGLWGWPVVWLAVSVVSVGVGFGLLLDGVLR